MPPRNDALAAEPVAGAPADDEQRAEHDGVGGDDPRQRRLSSRCGYDASMSGNATFTIERSSDAMNVPRAVTDEHRTRPPCSRSDRRVVASWN